MPPFRVTKVVRRYNGVKVTVENGKSFTADAAVIAVPLGVLKSKRILFEPKLPDWKEAAIAELGVGLENKIILHFENVFWPNVEFLGVVADTSYGCSYFLNLHKAARHPVLVYMPSGRLAKDIEKMSDEATANFAFEQLKKILPDASSPVTIIFLLISIFNPPRKINALILNSLYRTKHKVIQVLALGLQITPLSLLHTRKFYGITLIAIFQKLQI